MNIQIWCIGILIVATSCKREQASKAVNPATFTYTYYNNSKIDTAAGQAINAGNFTVFEYTHIFADDISIADDEHSDRIIFQIPNNQTSFTITDSQLSTAILKRWHYCFCIFVGPYPNTGGSITGNKLNNQWVITGNIKTSTTDSISISGNYQLK